MFGMSADDDDDDDDDDDGDDDDDDETAAGEAVGVRKPLLSSPTSPEPKHETPQHCCAGPPPLPSSPDGPLSSPMQH